MPPKRVPLKGEPDFTHVSDEVLKEFLDLTQQMIFVYQMCDSEKTLVMKEVWKQLNDEYADRLHTLVSEDFDRQSSECVSPVVHKIKMVKRIKRSK